MLVAFEPLNFIVIVVSFFFGAIVASSGVQHIWVGVRAVVLLLVEGK